MEIMRLSGQGHVGTSKKKVGTTYCTFTLRDCQSLLLLSITLLRCPVIACFNELLLLQSRHTAC